MQPNENEIKVLFTLPHELPEALWLTLQTQPHRHTGNTLREGVLESEGHYNHLGTPALIV